MSTRQRGLADDVPPELRIRRLKRLRTSAIDCEPRLFFESRYWNPAMRLFNNELKARREALGLDEDRVAKVLGLSPMSYFDLEAHSDEWDAVTPLHIVRFVCRWFELDLLDYVEETQGERLSRPAQTNAVIRERRKVIGLSEEAFAEACGFHPVFTSIIESMDGGIALYSFEVSRIACRVLGLELRSFAQFSLLAIF